MSDFETNLRSVEIALRHLPEELTGYASLVPVGVKIQMTAGCDDTAVRVIAWHEFASWRRPQGTTIIKQMVTAINQPKKVMP